MAVAHSLQLSLEPKTPGYPPLLGGAVDGGRMSSLAMSEGRSHPHSISIPETAFEAHASSPQPVLTNSSPSVANTSLKKRKLSKSKVSLELRRVASTPQIRGAAMSDSGPLSPSSADKRRNKLGYHRTSVACGHCRRRKIRCLLPSPEDPQGRCANCIRLKKDCVFYPVTEAGQHEPRSLKKPSSAGPTASASSTSPRTSAPSNQGSVDESSSKGVFPQPVRQIHNAPADGFTTPQSTGAPFYSQTYPYPGFQGAETWSPASYTSPSAQHPQESTSPYWTSSQLPASSAYQTSPPAAMGPPPSAGMENHGFAYSQGGQAWAQARSLSMGHLEQAPSRYPYHDLTHDHQQHGHPSHLPYPSPVSAHGQTRASTTDQYPPPTHANSSQPYPPQWQGYPPGQQPEFSGQWYAEPTAIGRAEDSGEAVAPFGHPGAYYANVSHPG